MSVPLAALLTRIREAHTGSFADLDRAITQAVREHATPSRPYSQTMGRNESGEKQ